MPWNFIQNCSKTNVPQKWFHQCNSFQTFHRCDFNDDITFKRPLEVIWTVNDFQTFHRSDINNVTAFVRSTKLIFVMWQLSNIPQKQFQQFMASLQAFDCRNIISKNDKASFYTTVRQILISKVRPISKKQQQKTHLFCTSGSVSPFPHELCQPWHNPLWLTGPKAPTN